MRTLAALLAVSLTCGVALADSPTLTPKEAAKHIGEHATVGGLSFEGYGLLGRTRA